MAQSIQQAVSDLTAKVEQTLGVAGAGDDSKQQGQGGAKTEVSGGGWRFDSVGNLILGVVY